MFEKHCPKYESTDELLSNCKKDQECTELTGVFQCELGICRWDHLPSLMLMLMLRLMLMI